jgi:carotenoid cleavage dioxygenase-like enzyme
LLLQRMVKQRNLPFSFKAEQGSRVGLLPRGAADDSGMIWFELPAHMVFHVANAWEEEDGTVKVRWWFNTSSLLL